jgi:hypothetical protein
VSGLSSLQLRPDRLPGRNVRHADGPVQVPSGRDWSQVRRLRDLPVWFLSGWLQKMRLRQHRLQEPSVRREWTVSGKCPMFFHLPQLKLLLVTKIIFITNYEKLRAISL